MKPKIAVSTVSGRAYYLVVRELKRKRIAFLSLTPTQPIPAQIEAVITTQDEEHFVKHDKILVLKDGVKLESLINKALRIIQGKENYENIVIGLDPGKVIGLAVLVDGEVVETGNCFSTREVLDKITNILGDLEAETAASISVKVGDGVPKYKDALLRALDGTLPWNVVLKSVGEERTNSYSTDVKHRRGLRDIVSAVKIASRNGNTYQRRKTKKNEL